MRESPLDVLLLDGVIDEVVSRLNSGKEADIFLVQHRGRVVAAKVYRDRNQRSFKHNADYKEGRAVRNSRTQRAIDSGSRYGRQVSEDEWGTTEARALHQLEAHGVRVPVPVMSYEGVLLMELVTDAQGEPAPRLIEMRYDPAGARAAYLDLRAQIIKMLCAEIVHGDLSAYNILAAAAGPTIIDFPQIVSAAHNSRAEFFFLRDYRNVYDFLRGFDPSLDASWDDGRQIWNAYVRRELTPEFVPPTGRPRFIERALQPPPRAPQGEGPRPHNPQRPYEAQRPQNPPRPQNPQRPYEAQRPQPPQRPYEAQRPQNPQRPYEAQRPQNPQRPYEAQRPQNPQRPYEAQRPQNPQRPYEAQRPQNAPRPHDAQRPQNAPRPHDAQRPQNPPRPHDGTRGQNPPRPHDGPRAQTPQRPHDGPRPQNAQRPQNGQRPQGGPRPQNPSPQPPDAPPALRSVRSRPKVYTSPDLPPRGVPKPEDDRAADSGSHRRRPKRRF
jgi:RIO kinase 1